MYERPGDVSMRKKNPWLLKVTLAVVMTLSLSSLDSYRSQTKVLDTKQEKTEGVPDNLIVHGSGECAFNN
jgi:hypothetical protein